VDLLIFIILGTQPHRFDRLLDVIQESSLNDQIIVQSSESIYHYSKMEFVSYIDFTEFDNYIEEASFIISHGGTGAIIQSLKKKKKVIVCARLKKFNEHINDHQSEIVNAFVKANYILELKEGQKLDEVIAQLETFEPKPFESNRNQFVKRLNEAIETFEEMI
jgi:UDP-N-acetylglucosamine transferase subunit ALG13